MVFLRSISPEGFGSMGTSSKELAEKLRKLAKRQHGCFTAAQAIETGYADSVHLYHVKTGQWIRVYRGVYRLADHPATPASRCMAAILWTRSRSGIIQGVLAADTAEALRQDTLSDREPVQIVVPKGFRRSSRVPFGMKIVISREEIHKTLNIYGIPAQIRLDFQAEQGKYIDGKIDRTDYYDLIDYHRVIYQK